MSDPGPGDRLPPWRSVLGWTVPTTVGAALNEGYGAAFAGHDPVGIDLEVTVDRTRQLAAVACNPSQAVPGSMLWRRLDLPGDIEHLRWLPRSNPTPSRTV